MAISLVRPMKQCIRRETAHGSNLHCAHTQEKKTSCLAERATKSSDPLTATSKCHQTNIIYSRLSISASYANTRVSGTLASFAPPSAIFICIVDTIWPLYTMSNWTAITTNTQNYYRNVAREKNALYTLFNVFVRLNLINKHLSIVIYEFPCRKFRTFCCERR